MSCNWISIKVQNSPREYFHDLHISIFDLRLLRNQNRHMFFRPKQPSANRLASTPAGSASIGVTTPATPGWRLGCVRGIPTRGAASTAIRHVSWYRVFANPKLHRHFYQDSLVEAALVKKWPSALTFSNMRMEILTAGNEVIKTLLTILQ